MNGAHFFCHFIDSESEPLKSKHYSIQELRELPGTRLGGTNLDFQIEQCIYKRKSGGICIINRKRPWEKLLLAAHAIVSIENSADVSVIPSRDIGQHVILMFTAAVGATPTAGCFTPGSSARWTQTDIALRDTDSPLCYVDIPSEQQEESSLSGSDVQDAGPGSSAHARHHVPGKWTTPAPEFTATQAEVAEWSEDKKCPLCLAGSFLKMVVLSPPPKTSLQLLLLRPLNGADDVYVPFTYVGCTRSLYRMSPLSDAEIVKI
eukprot:bmy_09450T0